MEVLLSPVNHRRVMSKTRVVTIASEDKRTHSLLDRISVQWGPAWTRPERVPEALERGLHGWAD